MKFKFAGAVFFLMALVMVLLMAACGGGDCVTATVPLMVKPLLLFGALLCFTGGASYALPKRTKRREWRTVPSAAGACMIGLVLVFTLLGGLPQRAYGQVTPTTTITATNLPAIVAGSTVSNQVSWIPLIQGRGLALQWRFNAASGTANGTLYVSPSVDGVNPSTNQIWPLVFAAASTTDQYITTNWSAANLAGYKLLGVWGISNAAAAANITNKGVIAIIPNS